MVDKDKALQELAEVAYLKLRDIPDMEKYAPLRHTIHNVGSHTGAIVAVAVTPDGRRALTGSGDRTAKLWDLESGRCLQTFTGHTNIVNAVAVTPDGRRALTGSGDRTAKLWDLESGRCLQTFTGHTSGVSAVAVTPDGSKVVTGSQDHTVKFWDLETATLLATLHNLDEGFLWTTPPDKNAPSGWLWTDRKDLVSVVKCNKVDNSHPEALADDDPDRANYLAVYNRKDMVMNRLCLSVEVIEKIEGDLEYQLHVLGDRQTPRQPPPQLEPGCR